MRYVCPSLPHTVQSSLEGGPKRAWFTDCLNSLLHDVLLHKQRNMMPSLGKTIDTQ